MKNTVAINKVLVIRFRRIGDAVLTSAVCSSVRKSFPEAEIHYVLNENIAPLFENHPDIDRIITFSDQENKSFLRYIGKVRHIVRQCKYDLIIDCRSTTKTLFFSLFSLSTPYRLGIRKKYNFLHNYKTDIRHYVSNVDRMNSLLSPLEKNYPISYIKDFQLALTEREVSKYRAYMQRKGIDFSKPVVVCTVAARLAHKIWNTDYMAQVLTMILEKYNSQLIFNFVGSELDVANSVKEKMGNPMNVFLDIEANSLRQLCALLKNSDFFFGNEGGPRHIAQALGIPAFAIYPPGIPKSEWLPNPSEMYKGIEPDDFLQTDESQPLTYQEAFNAITPEIVIDKIIPMLDEVLKKQSLTKENLDMTPC